MTAFCETHDDVYQPCLVCEIDGLRYALSLIRDGRCSCGGRFKWTGNQTRCEQCDRHEGWGIPKHYRDMARAALTSPEART